MREFPLRNRYRLLVFTGPKGWEIHNTDAKGRSIDSLRRYARARAER
jgi:hypothetical protein